MPIYDMYPYTNLHELNLDALIKLYKDFKAEIDGWEALFHGLETCFTFDDDNEIVNCAYEIIAPMGLRGNADSADRLNISGSVGSTTKPVYFNDGRPVACGSQLAVDITGNAATANLATNATSAGKFASGKTINLTGDVTGSVTTNFAAPTIDIATTVVNGGGGSEEKVIIDGSVTTEEYSPGECSALLPFNMEIDVNRLYTVTIDDTVYEHVYSYIDQNTGFPTIGDLSATWPFKIDAMSGITISTEDTISVKVIEEEYDCYFANSLDYNTFQNSGDAWFCEDSAYQAPLALLAGDYIVWYNGVKYELPSVQTGSPMIGDPESYLGDMNLSTYPFCILDWYGHTYSYRLYSYAQNTQPLADVPVKIFGPKQTGKVKTVTVKFNQNQSWSLTGGLGVGVIPLSTDVSIICQSNEYAFYFNGKKFIDCSVSYTSSIHVYDDQVGSPGGLTLEIGSHASSSVGMVGCEEMTLWYYNIDYRPGFEMDILDM